jgi:hypothetical protein
MREARNSRPAEDSVNPSCMKPVSAEQIRAAAKFLPIFENIKPDDFSHSVRLPGQEDVCYGVGFVEFHPAVNAFIEACYDNGFVQSFDWPASAGEAQQYMADPKLVASASLTTCIKLVTGHIRYERFCDGPLHWQFESGHLTAILRRLEELAEKRSRLKLAD